MESIIDILSQGRDREAQASKIYGVVIGVVTNNSDPDSLGRVKVMFPWLSDDVESWWARVAKPSAGTMIIPNIEDEVLLAFEHGDVRFPYILGVLDNGVDIPPTANDVTSTFEGKGYDYGSMDVSDTNDDGENNIIMFRTPRAGSKKTPKGSLVLFDDTKDKEKIVVASADGKQRVEIFSHDVGPDSRPAIVITNSYGDIKVVACRKPNEGGDITFVCDNFTVEARNDITMTAENEINVESTADTSFKSGANYNLEAMSNIDEKATGNVSIESTGTTTIKATGPMTVESVATLDCKSPSTTVNGDIMLTLKGGVVMIN